MSSPDCSLRSLIVNATTHLANAAIDSPRLSAEVLMAHCLAMDTNTLRKTLIIDPQYVPSPEQRDCFAQLCHLRATGTPVAYLTGTKEFFGLDFMVTPATLIPRPDTELLVELTIAAAQILEDEAQNKCPPPYTGRTPDHPGEIVPDFVAARNPSGESAGTGTRNCLPCAMGKASARPLTPHENASPEAVALPSFLSPRPRPLEPHGQAQRPFTFADLGTGSGCIAISLALHLPHWQGIAVDISPEALEVAQNNALRHHTNPLHFLQSSFCDLAFTPRSLHIIVSNPPYISTDHYTTLSNEVRGFEPQSALVPGTYPSTRHAVSCTSPKTSNPSSVPPALASPFPGEPASSTAHHGNEGPGLLHKTHEGPIPSPYSLHPISSLSSGLEDFETIIAQAELFLVPNGFLLMEMGFDQGRTLFAHLTERGWEDVSVHKDLAGHDRVIKARWPGTQAPRP